MVCHGDSLLLRPESTMNLATGQDMEKRIGLVACCTRTKRLPVNKRMVFHTLGPARANLLAKVWLGRAKASRDVCRAEDLYCGAGWTQVCKARSLIDERLGRTTLYILSAGFGLIRANDHIPAYTATFSSDENQVARLIEGNTSIAEAHREWWHSVMEARRDGSSSALTELHGHDYVIVVAGAEYVKAAHDDLRRLALTYGQDRLFIISTGAHHTSIDQRVRACLLPIGVEAERMLPGPRYTLNERALVWVVEGVISDVSWSRKNIQTKIAEELSQYRFARMPRTNRRSVKLGDEEIRQWIRLKAKTSPGIAKSRLLRDLRSTQQSCEQHRFGRLFDSVIAEGTE